MLSHNCFYVFIACLDKGYNFVKIEALQKLNIIKENIKELTFCKIDYSYRKLRSFFLSHRLLI